MFNRSTIDNSQCIASNEVVIASDATVPVKLPNPGNALKAVIQVFTDADGITAIGKSNLGYTPIAVINESADPATQGIPDNGRGFGLYNLGIYEVCSPKNIAQTSIMSYATGYKVYCRISYYK